MRKAALLLFCLACLPVPSAAADDEAHPPARDSRKYGQTLVAEFDVPDSQIEKFRKHSPGKPDKNLTPIENTLLADAEDWSSPTIRVDATKNPYTLVVTLTGTAPADGDAATMWLAGWAQEDGGVQQVALTGLTKPRVKAGERVVMTAAGGSSSFRKDRDTQAALGFISARNFEMESVHVQIWSGVGNASPLEMFLSLRALLVGLVLALLWWFFFKR